MQKEDFLFGRQLGDVVLVLACRTLKRQGKSLGAVHQRVAMRKSARGTDAAARAKLRSISANSS
jgi:hypothetical protein